MNIKDFKLEMWLNPRVEEMTIDNEKKCKYNLGVSCIKAFTLDEFLDFINEDKKTFYDNLSNMSLHYGHFFGMDRLKKAISNMYEKVAPDHVATVHGGTGANSLVLHEFTDPTGNVVAFIPNYQQHYSIPESLGAEVRYLTLKPENGYLPDINELKELVDENTKLITMSNPNNPCGSYINRELLEEIAEIARSVDAYIISDEIYRGLDTEYMASIADIYEKGIVTSSMSKVFSLAGTRLGWIIVRDDEAFERIMNRRSYDTICCGPFDELIAAMALENHLKVLERGLELTNTNKKIFEEWLEKHPKLHADYRGYGTTAFITYDYDIDTLSLCTDIFEKKGLLLCHGDCFEIPKSFRLGYGYDTPEHFQKCLNVFSEYLNELDNS